MAPKDDFASLLEGSQKDPGARRTGRRLRVGELVEGIVVQVGRDWVFVDIGGTSEARIERGELTDAKGQLQASVGQKLRASVARLGEEGPLLTLSVGRGAKSSVDLSMLREASASRMPVQGKVTRAVKAGVEVDVAGVRAFCPASQLDTAYVADLASFEGRTLDFLVSDIKEDGRSVVLSRRAFLDEAKARARDSVLERIAVGGEYEGRVTSLMKYGAFIDLGGGVEGLVHVSEIAHTRVERVEDALSVGDTVTVRVLAVEPQDKSPIPKLRLSIKALSRAPEPPQVAADEVLVGTVTKVGSFGVRVTTAKGEGLVPMRELGIPRGSDHRKAFPVGKEVKVVFVHRDASGRTTFSMARVAAVEESANYREFTRGGQSRPEPASSLGSLGRLLRDKLGLPEPAPEPPSQKRASAEKPAADEPNQAEPSEKPAGAAEVRWIGPEPAPPRAPDMVFKDVMEPGRRAPEPGGSAPLPDGVFKRRK